MGFERRVEETFRRRLEDLLYIHEELFATRSDELCYSLKLGLKSRISYSLFYRVFLSIHSFSLSLSLFVFALIFSFDLQHFCRTHPNTGLQACPDGFSVLDLLQPQPARLVYLVSSAEVRNVSRGKKAIRSQKTAMAQNINRPLFSGIFLVFSGKQCIKRLWLPRTQRPRSGAGFPVARGVPAGTRTTRTWTAPRRCPNSAAMNRWFLLRVLSCITDVYSNYKH